MTRTLLVLNAGSATVKFALFHWPRQGPPAALHRGLVDGIDGTGGGKGEARLVIDGGPARPVAGADHGAALEAIVGWLRASGGGDGGAAPIGAVGHRVVHGGPEHSEPVRIDARVRARLAALVPLAPLHQPHALAGIDAVEALLPGVPQVACFDTAFHRTQPPLEERFALPRALHDQGVRRYGFHGLSCEHVVATLGEACGGRAPARTIIAHLGSGASLTAVRDGRSIANTMGMTPLDGVPMGTRPGSLDPGVVLYLEQAFGMSPEAVEDLLYHRSGLLGVSGLGADMRTLLASDRPAAREAIDLFVYRVGRAVGSLAAALEGLDALVFTAGIGEGSPPIREAVAERCRWLGAALEPAANAAGASRIDAAHSRVQLWVLPTDEEQVIARHTARVAASGGP